MNSFQTYAHECGVQPGEPHDYPTVFLPLPEKYISFSGRSNPQQEYFYFNLVVGFLAPVLEKEGIRIIHLAQPDEPQIPGAIRISLGLRQSAHLVKNSLCHITVDNLSVHLAGNFNVPLIQLIVSAPEYMVAPHYKDKFVALSGQVAPEEVVKQVLDILGIKKEITLVSKYIGEQQSIPKIQLIPNFQPDYRQLGGELVVRMDQCHNEQVLFECLRHRESTNMIFNQPIQNPLPRQRLGNMMFLISDDYDKELILKLSKDNVKFVYSGPKENLIKMRLDLGSPYDCNTIHHLSDIKPPKDVTEDCLFSSQKVFLSMGRAYGSLWHAKRGIPGTVDVPIGKALNSKDFLDYLESYYIYKK